MDPPFSKCISERKPFDISECFPKFKSESLSVCESFFESLGLGLSFRKPVCESECVPIRFTVIESECIGKSK